MNYAREPSFANQTTAKSGTGLAPDGALSAPHRPANEPLTLCNVGADSAPRHFYLVEGEDDSALRAGIVPMPFGPLRGRVEPLGSNPPRITPGEPSNAGADSAPRHFYLVEGGGFEPPKLSRQIYSLIPLATREPLLKRAYILFTPQSLVNIFSGIFKLLA